LIEFRIKIVYCSTYEYIQSPTLLFAVTLKCLHKVHIGAGIIKLQQMIKWNVFETQSESGYFIIL